MRVTLNIWSLLCPLSPFFSSPLLCLLLCLRTKGSLKLCHEEDLRPCQSCFCYFDTDQFMSSQWEGQWPGAGSWRQNANPAEMSWKHWPKHSAHIKSLCSAGHVHICSLACHWEFQNDLPTFLYISHRTDGADRIKHMCIIIKICNLTLCQNAWWLFLYEAEL